MLLDLDHVNLDNKMSGNEIMHNFPFDKPRQGQLEIIFEILNAIEKGYKYIILEAGTGTGKSAIAATISKIYNPAYILTMTKQLQQQYTNDFGFSIVKGRNNFLCNHNGDTCDNGRCKLEDDKFKCIYKPVEFPYGIEVDDCSYWMQKADAIKSPITLMNYDYALLELNYVRHFGRSKLVIFDEAHNIENKLMKFVELNLSIFRLNADGIHISKDMLKSKSLNKWIKQLQNIKENYETKKDQESIKAIKEEYHSMVRKLEQTIIALSNEPDNWVIQQKEHFISFKPVKIHNYAKEYLLKFGDVCLFMSATILDHKLFSRWLGVNPSEVYSINVNSPFDVKKRPIICDYAGKMTQSHIQDSAPLTLPILKKILDNHRNEKGLIHTNSYNLQKYIFDNLRNSRLISHDSIDREEILADFKNSENPLVLVSPSMSEGVDLPYDDCSFQVIYKVPYPFFGDKQISTRKHRDPMWYTYKTIMTLMQMYGRGMRAEDDYCVTYVTDESLESVRFNKLMPTFFNDAVKLSKKKISLDDF